MILTNGEVLDAQGALDRLLQNKLPISTSFKLAKVANQLKEPRAAFDKVRDGLMVEFKIKREQKDDKVELKSEEEGGLEQFVEKLNELVKEENDLKITPVKLPEKIAATCDKCHHNMDKELEIEGSILVSLEKFITVGD